MMLRRSGVIDEKILAAIERTPRDAFVPAIFRDQAYEDTALPIGNGQTISRPSVVAFMTAMLAPGPRMRVLEIGTGSGYQAGRAHLALPQGVYNRNGIARFSRKPRRGSTGSGSPTSPHAAGTACAAGPGRASLTVSWLRQRPTMCRLRWWNSLPRAAGCWCRSASPDGVQRLVCLSRTEDGVEVEALRETSFVPLVGAYDEPASQEAA